MKGFIIFEDFKKFINCKEILDGYYNCVISDCPNGTFSGVINRVTGARCNKDDTYDFETGALIALMKMCGLEKSAKAYAEMVEKLKLDCEKLQHGYVDTDMIFCGGRGCGKQYKALVELFKKIPKDKVDAAYKEAYNTTIPVWQKEVLRQACNIVTDEKEKRNNKESLNWCTSQSSTRDHLDSLIEGYRAFTRKFDNGWLYRIPTKRDEMWENILGASKCPPVEIKVAKQDITSFLRELQDKIPEVQWNGSDCSPLEYTNPYWFKHEHIYFALFRYDDKGILRICYDEKPHSWINKPIIEYIAPMRWDLFKKGRIVVGVKNINELEEFRKEVERNTGIKDIPTCPTNLCLFYSFDKDNYKIILEAIGESNSAKINSHKVVYWEDVR